MGAASATSCCWPGIKPLRVLLLLVKPAVTELEALLRSPPCIPGCYSNMQVLHNLLCFARLQQIMLQQHILGPISLLFLQQHVFKGLVLESCLLPPFRHHLSLWRLLDGYVGLRTPEDMNVICCELCCPCLLYKGEGVSAADCCRPGW
jgi:hypothetical protein